MRNLTAMTGQTSSKTDLNRRFSGEIRAELARSRTSAATLAPLLGVSEATIYRRLKGQTDWPLDDAMIVAAHLGVSISRLTSQAVA